MAALKEKALTLLSTTTVSHASATQTTLFTVPVGKRCVLHSCVIVAAGNESTTAITIGQNGALTDWLGTQTLSNLDAANDAVILQPVPNATPVKLKSYAETTLIKVDVTSAVGNAGNSYYLFGFLY